MAFRDGHFPPELQVQPTDLINIVIKELLHIPEKSPLTRSQDVFRKAPIISPQ